MKKQILPDILAQNLKVVFCGLNPGLSSSVNGHHFMNKSNRFWKVLYLSGFTSDIIRAEKDHDLLKHQCGLTTAVSRATAKANELSKGEFKKESLILEEKILNYHPEFIAFLGKAAFVEISGNQSIDWGLQNEVFGGAKVWILPNPSGLNRSFGLQALVDNYTNLYKASYPSVF